MTTAVLLIAEDEFLLVPDIEEALEEAGYQIVITSNGTDAIAQLETDASRFKALITDIRMGPGPTGWDVAHRARELSPSLPVIYMTGDSAASWAANGVPNSVLLQKPFVMAQLVVAVSQLITQSSALPPT
jgi:DNA-binding NtrC family response regulator